MPVAKPYGTDGRNGPRAKKGGKGQKERRGRRRREGKQRNGKKEDRENTNSLCIHMGRIIKSEFKFIPFGHVS